MIPQKFLDEQLKDPGAIKGFFGDYRWLSNFHLCDIRYEGIVYPSTENAFQAAKFPQDKRPPFASCTPGQAKKMSRDIRLTPEEVEIWNSKRLKVMLDITLEKFGRHDDLWALLCSVKGKYLEETNWWGDKFWGVCDGQGENHLGKTIMEAYRLLSETR